MSGPRIGIAFTGDANDPTARSGTPYGVLQGVRALGVDATAVRAAPPEHLDRGLALLDALARTAQRRVLPSRPQLRDDFAAGLQGAATARVRTAWVRGAVSDVDAVLQLGTSYQLPAGTPYVAYDDMTVAQALRHPYPEWTAMRPRDQRFRLAQQREVYLGAVTCAMTSTWAARSVVQDYGVPPERVRVVGAGTHEAPRTVDRDWSTPRLLFIGLDWKRKNGPRVLRAFEALRREHPGATLDVVGRHPAIEQAGVRTHGVVRRSTPEGAAQLRGLFDRATCFVMPSLYEPAGVVFTEAAAAGLPSIGGTVGGSTDFIGEGGSVVDPTDDEALLEAMRRFADPAVAAEVGALAAARSPLFTWTAVAGRLLRALGDDVVAPPAVEYLPPTGQLV